MVASIGKIASASQGVAYFERDGYYAGSDPAHREASAWAGEGADALGLSGPVDPDAFTAILEGKVPGGSQLGRRDKDGNIHHRPGRDVCHNSEDKPTAENIAIEMIKAGHEAFFDKWDIRPGDSLIEKISEGISDSSYLLVLLSRNSVKSNWVKRELEIALARQIADKAITVIPCLLEDCDIPVFLQPISYADFRSSFERGITDLLPAIEKVDGIASGRLRIGDEAWTHDFAIDYALPDPKSGEYSLKFVILSWYGTEEFSCTAYA